MERVKLVFMPCRYENPTQYGRDQFSFQVLQKWEQKEVRFMGRHLELPDDCRLLFVTQKRIKIEPQLRRIVNF